MGKTVVFAGGGVLEPEGGEGGKVMVGFCEEFEAIGEEGGVAVAGLIVSDTFDDGF